MAAQTHIKTRIIAISLSFTVSLLLMATKFYGYKITGSAAILSDALESIINVIASAFALGSILVASRPPDKDHPYGHGKIEYFSAGFEGALIMLAAGGIFMSGWPKIFHPEQLPNLDTGMLLILGTAIVNLILAEILIKSGKKTGSLALTADGKHILTDVYSTVAVLLGLLLVKLTGKLWLDGAVACLVGLNILYAGGVLVVQAFSGLMNTADPRLLEEISRVISFHRRPCWIDIHQLRAWTSGNLVHMDFHLILPRDLSLEAAHNEAKNLEMILMDHYQESASILIHMDPCIAIDCPICASHSCSYRAEDAKARIPWTVETMTMIGWGKTV
jgi:cation diffusion facilitator family transporter